MKKLWLACTMAMIAGISSCVNNDKDLYQEDPGKQTNTSNFSTEQTVQVEIDYSKANSKVQFFVYEQSPLTVGENTMTLNENIEPLDGAWTDEQGKFVGKLSLPTYLSTVYIVSKSVFAETIMQGKITNGTLKISDTDATVMSRATTRASSTSYDSNRFKRMLGWETKLGEFDSRTGVIKYAYKGNDPALTLSKTEMNDLRTRVNKVLNTLGSCPQDIRTKADLYVEKENTAVVLTALKGWTCWNNSLGYYYYRLDSKPASLRDVKVYTIFPNTQMSWSSGNLSASPQGVTEGTAVELKYFDDPAHPEGTNFPAGYSIGFVLACNTWNTYFTGFNSYTETNKGYFACSTDGLSSLGANGISVHTAMFKDSNKNIAIAFEDFKDDENFTDVVFSLKANPEIKNVPEVNPDLNTTIRKTGIYAFEDEWPKAKDYDMNDVLVQYTYQKTFNIYNEILQEVFTFKTFANVALNNNGLAFTLKNVTSGGTTTEFIKYYDSNEFAPIQFTHESGNVTKLTDNVKTNMNAEYRTVIDYNKNIKKTKETSVDAFIFRNTNNDKRLEVHCPMQAPTAKADYSFFGQFDDRSEPEKGIYYVSDKNTIYPFAFYLHNATADDIAPLLDKNNESKPINELYPKFLDWAQNGTNPDWYKKK